MKKTLIKKLTDHFNHNLVY